MRIGFDITPLTVPRSGVGTYTACLLAHLKQEGNAIVTLSHFPEDYRWSEGGVYRSPKTFNKTLWMQLLLRQQIKRLRLDVCHFTNSVAPLWSPRPTVLTIHDMTLWLYPDYHPWRRRATMRPIVPMAARQAAAVITVSHSAKEDIMRILGVPPEKISVIYEAPDRSFRPLTSGPELLAVRRQYNLPESFILHVGTLEPRKNLVRLLEAFAILRERQAIDHDMVFVGKMGWSYSGVFAAVERLGLSQSVHFLDFVPNRWLAAIYNLATALVYPSHYEGFGLPVVEAMACGTPVISSPNGALAEIASDAAAFVQAEDVLSIAETIHQVLNDEQLRAEMRVKGLARSSEFSWKRAAEQTHLVYRHVAAGSRSPAIGNIASTTTFGKQAESG